MSNLISDEGDEYLVQQVLVIPARLGEAKRGEFLTVSHAGWWCESVTVDNGPLSSQLEEEEMLQEAARRV